MLTFTQFRRILSEKFLAGFDANFGYAEIYKNPNSNEWTQVGHKQDPPWDLESYGAKCYYAGGILTPKDLFVFDRQHAEHFATAREIPKLGPWFPLYCYYFPGPDVLALSPSSFSFTGKDKDAYYKSRAENPDLALLKRKVKGHPQLKKFTKVVDIDGKKIPI